MRQGLIAKWLRGIAGRGLVGALLLTVPVLVAATIGFGGAEGLSSLASGPSDAAVGDAPAQLTANRSLESLTASLSPLTAKQAARNGSNGGGQPTSAGGPGGTTPGTVPSNGQLSGTGAGPVGPGITPGPGTTTNPTIPGASGLNINGIPGGGSGGQPGLLGGLLYNLGLGPK